jgi:hypothetical protein
MTMMLQFPCEGAEKRCGSPENTCRETIMIRGEIQRSG